jgi:hypothetical protein
MPNTDVTKMSFFAPDPKLMTVDFNQLEKTQQQRREEMATLNPPKPEGHAKELQRLRRELFNLSEGAKNNEIYRNNKAGEVRLFEQRLTDAIKQKKVAIANGNERGERNHEHAIKQRERDLADAEKEFQKAEQCSAQAARALKDWPHYARIEELEKLVG